ncbi:MAG: hypothetical protein ACYCO0_03250 [Candidatus Micrarchaeaceae archaeon]
MADKRLQVFVIADYGREDPAFIEVNQFISNLIHEADVQKVCVEPFSTTQTGFWAYQLALNHSKLMSLPGGDAFKTYLFLNTAPRKSSPKPQKDNEGERLAYARLDNGMEVVGVLSGESFSFIKPMIKNLRTVDVPDHGSQFRSRDIFPFALRDITEGNYSCLGRKITLGTIPEPEINRIAHVDGYGNIKLTTPHSCIEFREGDKVAVTIGYRKLDALFSDSMFGVKEGLLCLAPGSSGPKDDAFLEISKRSGNAWKEFGEPKIGSALRIEFKKRA